MRWQNSSGGKDDLLKGEKRWDDEELKKATASWGARKAPPPPHEGERTQIIDLTISPPTSTARAVL